MVTTIALRGVRLVGFMLVMVSTATYGQTTAFTYQGQLSAAGALADGSFDVRFALFDSLAGGAQIGAEQTVPAVPVSDGVFTVQLDFGVNAFPGANRFVEIAVRPAGVGDFTTLAPRQQISSSPYAIRTLSAATADALSDACVGCVQDAQIQGIAGSKVSGTIPAASIPTGSGNYIQNTAAQQPTSNFNISGNGTVGGTFSATNLGVGTDNPSQKLEVAGNVRVSGAGNGVVFPDGTKQTTAGGGVSGSGTTSSIPLWTAGATLGDSLITQTGSIIRLPNIVTMAAGVQGNAAAFGSPNGETGLSLAGASGRTDLRFDGTTVKLVAGPAGQPPAATNGVAITTGGSVGIGTTTPTTGRLHVLGGANHAIYGESANRGVWGRSTGASRGVHGDSVSGDGVHGESVSGAGVAGVSHGPGANAVVGFNDAGGNGVFGQSFGGFNTGFAMVADGHAKQTRDKGGWVKAMVFVDGEGTIQRCYNSQSPVVHASGDCDISVTRLDFGMYKVDFGFAVSDRFVSVTPVQSDIQYMPAAFLFPQVSPNAWGVEIRTLTDLPDNRLDSPFMIIVF